MAFKSLYTVVVTLLSQTERSSALMRFTKESFIPKINPLKGVWSLTWKRTSPMVEKDKYSFYTALSAWSVLSQNIDVEIACGAAVVRSSV